MKRNIAGPWLAALAAVLGMVFFASAVAYSYRQQQNINHQLCQSAVANRAAIRTTWEAARKIVLEGQDTPEGRQVTNTLFDGILEAIPPLSCVDSNPAPRDE